MLNTWLVTFGILDDKGNVTNTISIKVKSNNEFCARDKAKRSFHLQYHYITQNYKIIRAKLIERFF